MFKFTAIDDYFHLFGDQKYLEQGNDFKALVSKYFDNKENPGKKSSLIFCLIEKVTLQNLDAAIGETYIYSPYFDDEKNAAITKKYKNLIREVKDKFNLSISQYKDWYTRGSYILIKENNSNHTFGETKWRLDGKAQTEGRNRNHYAQKEEKLDEKAILDYLEFYAEKLHEDEEIKLKQYPNYAIVVRPISVRLANGSIYPLGNLYLHFATKEKKTEDFYARFINDFMIVWMKNTGGILVQEIKRLAVNEQREAHRDHVPNLGTAGINKWKKAKLKDGNTLDDLCRLFVGTESYLNQFNLNLRKIKDEFIPILLKKKAICESEPAKSLSDFKIYWRKGGKSGPQNIEEFADMLVRRNIAFIGIFLFDYLVGEMHSLLSGGTIKDVDYDARSRAVYNYLWVNLLIPTGNSGAHIKRDQKEKLTTLKETIYSSLSNNEKDFLNDCYNYIITQISPIEREKFDLLVFAPVRNNF